MKNKLTKGDEKKLADFLAKHRHDGALTLLEAKGFLFMVACCPDPIMPSQWLPRVMGEDTAYASQSEAQDIVGSVFALSNQINRQVTEGNPKLPKECRILPDPLKNFEPPAPIHQWSRGFMEGYGWLHKVWQGVLEGEVLDLFTMNLFILGAPAGRRAFEDTVQEKSPEKLQAKARGKLEAVPDALQTFATISRVLCGIEHPNSSENDHIH
jgi:uncharacterized protein